MLCDFIMAAAQIDIESRNSSPVDALLADPSTIWDYTAVNSLVSESNCLEQLIADKRRKGFRVGDYRITLLGAGKFIGLNKHEALSELQCDAKEDKARIENECATRY